MSKNFYELRTFPNGKDQYKKFIEKNFVAIGWPEVPDISDLSSENIRSILETEHPDYDRTKVSQIVGFFDKLKLIKKGDIILIPYSYNQDPIITVAQVTGKYQYSKKSSKEHMAHQIPIKILSNISRRMIFDKFKNLHLSLNARLTLTTLKKDEHKEALEDIYKRAIHHKGIAKHTGNTNSIIKTYDELHTEYKETLTTLKNKINSSDDDLIVRSLLFSAFTLQEELVKTLIIKKSISERNEIFTIIMNEIESRYTRAEILSMYFEVPDIPEKYIKLRNAMAHNFNSTKVYTEKPNGESGDKKKKIVNEEQDITNNTEKEAIYIDEIFETLHKFSTDLKEFTVE